MAFNFPFYLAGAVDHGIGEWNSSYCNQYGEDFPYFQRTAGAQATVTVNWNWGVNPDNPRSCGTFDRFTHEINLYERARDQREQEYSCGNDIQVIGENLAHELGHYLGLDHPTGTFCSPSLIMSPLYLDPYGSPYLRDPSDGECGRADELNNTPQEGFSTDPEDPFCDAYCWTSCIDGVCPSQPPGYEGCPILFDIRARGFQLTGIEDPVWFDIDADGEADQMSWTLDDDAFLALDRDGNGTIDHGGELFGNYTRLVDGSPAPNGYAALAELDLRAMGGNDNGQIDPGDWIHQFLWLWSDVNHNGVSESEEIVTLEEAGITRISLAYQRGNRRDEHGNMFRFKSRAWKFNRNGVEHPILTWDVFFVVSP